MASERLNAFCISSAPDIARFAYKEGLTGHARSAMIRLEEEEEKT